VVRTIDEFPILAVAATQAQGLTWCRCRGAAVKETDRIATTVEELRRLGAEIEAQPDGFLCMGPHGCGERLWTATAITAWPWPWPSPAW